MMYLHAVNCGNPLGRPLSRSYVGVMKASFICLAMASFLDVRAQPVEMDSFGFYAKPDCGVPNNIRKVLLEQEKEKPTGLVATSPGYQLEIYANVTDTNWTLIGANQKGQLCMLDSGHRGYPARVKSKAWWKLFFEARYGGTN